MSTTAVVAVYAALIATAGLLWQIYTWTTQHRTRVRVLKRYGFIMLGGGPGTSVLSVEAINRSAHPVHIASVGFMTADRKQTLMIMQPMPGASLPGPLAPRTSGSAFSPLDDFEQDGYDTDGLVAYVRLQTGDVICSKRAPRLKITFHRRSRAGEPAHRTT